jgi:hypothetical protein
MDWNFEHQMSLNKSIQTIVYIFKVRCSIAVSKMTTDLSKMTTDLSNGRKRNCKQEKYDHNDSRLYDC